MSIEAVILSRFIACFYGNGRD